MSHLHAFTTPPPPSSPSQSSPAIQSVSTCSAFSRRAFLALVSFSLCPSVALATTTVPLYDEYADKYDLLDGSNKLTTLLGLPALRRRLISRATGNVLELGHGTGLNQSYFSPATKLTALDQSGGMLKQARRRAANSSHLPPITFVQADAANTGLPTACFDTVVDTFCLCVYSDPQAVLREIRRVLRPGGTVLLLEHTASNNAILAAYQDVTAAPTRMLSKGCLPNQRVRSMVEAAGFSVVSEQRAFAGTIVALELMS